MILSVIANYLTAPIWLALAAAKWGVWLAGELYHEWRTHP